MFTLPSDTFQCSRIEFLAGCSTCHLERALWCRILELSIVGIVLAPLLWFVAENNYFGIWIFLYVTSIGLDNMNSA